VVRPELPPQRSISFATTFREERHFVNPKSFPASLATVMPSKIWRTGHAPRADHVKLEDLARALTSAERRQSKRETRFLRGRIYFNTSTRASNVGLRFRLLYCQ
jgi:hypothetical protein